MELAAYLHDALVYEQSQQGTELERPIDCAFVSNIANVTTHSVALTKATLKTALARTARSTISMTLVAGTVVGGGLILPAAAQTPEVAILQDLLLRKGFDPGEIDGVKGSNTEEAIIQAQNFYGLESDGIVGVMTLAALQNDPYPEVDSSEQASDAVVKLQKLLADRGFYHQDIDGIEGSQTQAAIVAAQKFYGLTQDGVAGSVTIAALEADTGNPTDNTGSEKDVTALQKLLASRGFYSGSIDGIEGSQTQAAIVAAQKFYGLTQDGVAGSATIAALEADKVISTTPSDVSSNDVAYVQKLLTTQGFYSGSIDGIEGSQTQAAIVSAQRFFRLIPDGIAGPATIAALQNGSFRPTVPPVAIQPVPNSEIANIQNLLKDRGFYTGSIDGIFGSATRSALVIAQNAYGFTPTGVPDRAIVSALESSGRPVPSNPIPVPPISNNVSDVQRLLAMRGFYTGQVDGVLSQETKNAISRAQSFYGINPADGSLSSTLTASLNRDPYVASSIR